MLRSPTLTSWHSTFILRSPTDITSIMLEPAMICAASYLPKHCLYPGHQLTYAEWLRYVIIGAVSKSRHLVDFLGLGRDHDYRRIGLRLSAPLHISYPVFPGSIMSSNVIRSRPFTLCTIVMPMYPVLRSDAVISVGLQIVKYQLIVMFWDKHLSIISIFFISDLSPGCH